MATGSETRWHGQVRRLLVVLGMGAGISECGLGAAVLVAMAHVQVPQLRRGERWVGTEGIGWHVVTRGRIEAQGCMAGSGPRTAPAQSLEVTHY